jgi:transcriptional regulator with XRE-family HTH domain
MAADKSFDNWKAMSDPALLKVIGAYIRHHRLDQNKTQDQLAREAGINRSTLIEFERGKRSNTLTLIQLLRALNQLDVIEQFKVLPPVSPIQLANLEKKKRKRASKKKTPDNKTGSDW